MENQLTLNIWFDGYNSFPSYGFWIEPSPGKWEDLFFFFYRLTVLTLFFFSRLFTPIVLVPMVCVVGLGLFMRGFPLVTSFKTPSWHWNLITELLCDSFMFYIACQLCGDWPAHAYSTGCYPGYKSFSNYHLAVKIPLCKFDSHYVFWCSMWSASFLWAMSYLRGLVCFFALVLSGLLLLSSRQLVLTTM